VTIPRLASGSRGRGAPRDERPAWTPKQLEALFRSPIWMGCRSARERHIPGPGVIRDHQYFLPLLGAYAGLRLEEGCQLNVDDVGSENGVAFLSVRPGDGKPLKSRAAVRRVPLHSVLIDAGFLQHVEDARRKGSVLVFPELDGRRGGPDQRLGAAVTKAFTAPSPLDWTVRQGPRFPRAATLIHDRA
jgi:integrase